MKKNINILIALICAITMLMPTCIFATEDVNSGENGKITGTVMGYVYFGSYPQIEIVSKSSDSGSYGRIWDDNIFPNNNYLEEPELYKQLEDAEWDECDDTIIGENRYHRLTVDKVTFAEGKSNYTTLNYYNWASSPEVHYFMYEPIKWRVLEQDGDEAFLLSEIALDGKKYNDSGESCTWETSSVRNWLNSTFLDRAFSVEEQSAIKITNVENKGNITGKTEDSKDTQDKIYLLSESEVYTRNAVKYGFASDKYDGFARSTTSSSFAKAMGVSSTKSYDNLGRLIGICSWWLRSPGRSNSEAAVVSGGYVNAYYGDGNDNPKVAIRPALHIDLKKTDYFSSEEKTVEKTIDDVRPKDDTVQYTGEEYEIEIPGLRENIDYTISYQKNKNPGEAKATIKGIGEYEGSITKTFEIELPEETEPSGTLHRKISYDCINFGSYPQKEIVYSNEISVTYGKKWENDDDYIVDEELYEKLMAAGWDTNDDAVIDGEKYHRLTRENTLYSSYNSFAYFNWSSSLSERYFKYEPIKWKVLKTNGNNALLLSDYALDVQKYSYSYSEDSSCLWSTSLVRDWLNSTFINNAFTTDEKTVIKITNVDVNSNDKIFLLSDSDVSEDAEAVRMGFDYYDYTCDKIRMSKSSTYAKARGVSTNSNGYGTGYCEWLLRPPGKDNAAASYVDYEGIINRWGYKLGTSGYMNSAIRPALYIDLTSFSPESAGNTGIQKTMENDELSIQKYVYLYRNKPVTPKVEISYLVEGEDYEVKYLNNDKPGIATISVTGKGDWTGEITKNFVIVDEIDISERNISIPNKKYYYEGSPVCPKVSIDGLEENTDYTVSYDNNNKVGIGKITVTGKDGYSGTITQTFLINACENHSYGEWATVKNPNCSEPGKRTRTCPICKSEQTEEIETIPHKLDKVEATEQTYTQDGNNEYYKCSECGKCFKDAEGTVRTTQASEILHNWHADYKVDKEPTCTEKGEESIYCRICDARKPGSTVEILEKDHNWMTKYTVDECATCTEAGSKSIHCKYCDEVKPDSSETIEAEGHSYGSWETTKEPNCTEVGSKHRICSKCKGEDTAEISATGHKWEPDYTVDKKANCTEAGSKSIHCKYCDEVKSDSSETIEAEGHSYGSWETTKEPNCTEVGSKHRICSKCKGEDTAEISATGHKWEPDYTVDKKANCTEAGSKSIHCKYCDEVKSDSSETIEAEGHSYGSWETTKEPTCSEVGSKHRICSKCKGEDTAEVSATGHKWETDYTVDKKANCTEAGSKSIHCKYCDEIKLDSSETIEVEGHSYGSWETTKEPTCTEVGSKHRICSKCKGEDTAEVSATGHKWETDYTVDKKANCTEAGSKSIHCKYCDEVKSDSSETIEAEGHSYGSWETTKEPTCTEVGSKHRICSKCKGEDTAEVSATGHKWETDYTVDKKANCTEAGSKSIHCKYCDEVKEGSEVVINPGHSYCDFVIEPTCTQKGHTLHICGACGDSYTDTEVNPINHDFGEWEEFEGATCTKEGSEKRVCKKCGYTETRGVSKKNHTWETEYTVDKKATCTTDGSKSYHCSDKNCEAIKGSTVIEAKGHNFSGWVETKLVTCTKDGVAERVCNVCDTKEEVVLKAFGHKESEVYTTDVEATCTSTGLKSHHCLRCDEAIGGTEVTIQKLDHNSIITEAKAATCTANGNVAYWHCSDCDKYYSDAEGKKEIAKGSLTINALGHAYNTVPAGNGCSYKQCSRCGYKTAYTAPSYVKSFKVSKGKKCFTAKWKKQSKKNLKKFNGYQIRYSTKSNMAGAKYKNISKKKTSIKISKLGKKTRYYVQLRTYTGGFYSGWSTKTVVTK